MSITTYNPENAERRLRAEGRCDRQTGYGLPWYEYCAEPLPCAHGIEALAEEWERRYQEREHMVGCPEGAGYYDLLADELRALIPNEES